MRAHRFTATTRLDAPAERVWRFHVEPGALEGLSPPLLPMKVVDPGRGVAEGSEVVLELGLGPLASRWRALHTQVREGHEFVDVALDSPFPYWIHHHRISAESEGRSRLTDTVWYLPPDWLPRWLARPVIHLALWSLFWWRHRQTRRAVQTGSIDTATAPRHPAGSSTGA